MPRGRKYQEAITKVDREKLYETRAAFELLKEISFENFDATVEVHLRMGLDPRQSDQQVRGTVVLPHGLGKTVRVLVFAEGDAAKAAEKAGADFIAADDEMIKKINDGWTEFDVAIAVPQMMGKVGRLGRVLGPRGLMPNPKTGTVIPMDDLPQAIEEAKAGRIEYRLDKTANIHLPLGKISFSVDQLRGNFLALMQALVKARPASSKGAYIRRITIATTMSPGIKIDPLQAQGAVQ